MEFDWSGLPFDEVDGKEAPTMREIEETFEDPHSLRLFPDSPRFAGESRTFCLGKTLNGRGVFSVFRADGKRIRVISARTMTEEEDYFYERKLREWTS